MFNDLPIATKLEMCIAHAWRVRCMNFQDIPPMEVKIQPRKYIVVHVKCP